jgi:DNA invertase Pin-like site-specific DNA recombinase
LVFAIFAGVAEFERELIVERTKAGLAATRALGHYGGRPFKITLAKLRLARAAMGQPEMPVRMKGQSVVRIETKKHQAQKDMV